MLFQRIFDKKMKGGNWGQCLKGSHFNVKKRQNLSILPVFLVHFQGLEGRNNTCYIAKSLKNSDF